ncbi:MAG: dihydroorotase [Cyanobacteriota bacterium]|nr:dihydroorotase [Cyanobacteriota bacterium]
MPSEPLLWLQQLALLAGPGQQSQAGEALIDADGALLATGETAGALARQAGLTPRSAAGLLLAPALVDPHSVLEDPLLSRAETLTSLAAAAAAGGYGQVALLPWGEPPRDHPGALQWHWPEPLRLHLWASLSCGDGGTALTPHRELLEAGAIGLASDAELPDSHLLQRSLELGEAGSHPLLLAPRQRNLSGGGLVRESVEALRAGWPTDPIASETLPLASLISLQQMHPQQQLVLMNLSTQAAIAALQSSAIRPMATVHWWHLLHDSGSQAATARGWRLEPPLGAPGDRSALREALRSGLISAVAVHHQALDAEEELLPIDQRRPGLAGHGLVLALLWQELVGRHGWSASELWQALCWGPCSVLGRSPEVLEPGSRRWLLFDPQRRWRWSPETSGSLAANQALAPQSTVTGLIRATGLLPASRWQLD